MASTKRSVKGFCLRIFSGNLSVPTLDVCGGLRILGQHKYLTGGGYVQRRLKLPFSRPFEAEPALDPNPLQRRLLPKNGNNPPATSWGAGQNSN